MSRLSEAKGHRDRIRSVFQLPDHQVSEQNAGAYRSFTRGKTWLSRRLCGPLALPRATHQKPLETFSSLE